MENLNTLLFIVAFGLFPIATGIFITFTALSLNLGVYTWAYLSAWGVVWYVFLREYGKRERKKRPD